MSRPLHAREECLDGDPLPVAVALRTSPRTDRGLPDALCPPGHERRHPQTVPRTVVLIRDRAPGRCRHLRRPRRQDTVGAKQPQLNYGVAPVRFCGDHLCRAVAAAENAKGVDLAGSRLSHEAPDGLDDVGFMPLPRRMSHLISRTLELIPLPGACWAALPHPSGLKNALAAGIGHRLPDGSGAGATLPRNVARACCEAGLLPGHDCNGSTTDENCGGRQPPSSSWSTLRSGPSRLF